MKKAFFSLLICSLMVACAPDNTNKKTNDPIENLIAYLDEQGNEYAHRQVVYEGGSVLKTTVNYYISSLKPTAISKIGQKEGREREIRRALPIREREREVNPGPAQLKWKRVSANMSSHFESILFFGLEP